MRDRELHGELSLYKKYNFIFNGEVAHRFQLRLTATATCTTATASSAAIYLDPMWERASSSYLDPM